MDNTLAIFSRKGKENKSLESMFEQGFFLNLEIMENVSATLEKLAKKGYSVNILSACINSEHCKKEKIEWIRQYLPFIPASNIYLCDVGVNKAEFIGDVKNSLLVDDYWKNLVDWEKAGGIPIKKRSSSKNGWKWIIRDHSDIWKILQELE